MQTIESVHDMRARAAALKEGGRKLAMVTTSGALHAGHTALIAMAKSRADVVVLVLFPNPLAFGPSENFAKYPRTPDADLKVAAELQVDVVFTPSADEMFAKGFSTFVVEEAVSKPLCGPSRPTHFRGVTTGMAKLLNIVRPDLVVMGQRDAQQIAVVRKMIADLCFGADVVVAPIVRDSDGLPVSVRNRDLSPGQREEASSLHKALLRAREMAAQGVRSPDRIIAEVTHLLGQRRQIRVIYISIVDPVTMQPRREVVPGSTLLAIAVWVAEVRMIDNIEL